MLKSFCQFNNWAILLMPLVFVACHNGQGTDKSNKKIEKPAMTLNSPEGGARFKAGDSITFSYSLADSIPNADSITLTINQVKQNFSEKEKGKIIWYSGKSKMGQALISINYFAKGKNYSCSGIVYMLAPQKPKEISYTIVKTYPHDIEAYTEGLLVDNGVLYESAGEYKHSTLRKYAFPSMKLISKIAIADSFFAEGLALYKNKLYQLTYQEQTCFIYSASDLSLQKRLNYSMVEGWGLVFNGKELVCSDGSSTLYFLDPETLKETHRIEVYDDKKAITQLNELEYINGKIFCNIYQTDNIAEIDPATGQVLAMMNMKGLLKESDKHPKIDVLNGIAGLPNGNILVTGKNWPKLYEIKLKR
jgi:glutamine cyclotransferase